MSDNLKAKTHWIRGWKAIFQLRKEVPWQFSAILTLSSFVVLIGLYVLKSEAAVGNIQKSTFFPVLAEIGEGALYIFQEEDGKIWKDIGMSTRRVFSGFLLAALIAVPLGIYMGAYRAMEALLQPMVEFIRYFPVPALIPLLVALYGVDEEPKTILIFIGTFFQMILMVADEIRRVSQDLVRAAYTLGATQFEVLTKILLRSALPGIFDAMRLCQGWAWTYVVVAELIATNDGMGIRIMKFARFVQMPKVICYLLILGIIGLLIDWAFRGLHKWAFHWSEARKS